MQRTLRHAQPARGGEAPPRRGFACPHRVSGLDAQHGAVAGGGTVDGDEERPVVTHDQACGAEQSAGDERGRCPTARGNLPE